MQDLPTDYQQIKDVLKVAILELFQENRELITELFSETLEDIAMEKAILEGEKSDIVSRDEIFEILDA